MVGAVTDTSGAVVPGAKITVTNTDAGFRVYQRNHARGDMVHPQPESRLYQLRIEAAGFKTYVQNGITLRTAEQPRIDVKLEVGNVTESIQVTGTPPLLETETATSGQVLEGQTIVKMPVLQKAFYRMYLYMPGMNVVNGQHAIGQRQRALGFTIDGVNAKEPVLGNPNNFDTVMTTSLDMIQEFKMYTTGSAGRVRPQLRRPAFRRDEERHQPVPRQPGGPVSQRPAGAPPVFRATEALPGVGVFEHDHSVQSVHVSRNGRDRRRAGRDSRTL